MIETIDSDGVLEEWADEDPEVALAKAVRDHRDAKEQEGLWKQRAAIAAAKIDRMMDGDAMVVDNIRARRASRLNTVTDMQAFAERLDALEVSRGALLLTITAAKGFDADELTDIDEVISAYNSATTQERSKSWIETRTVLKRAPAAKGSDA
jgi:hypothetical protein